MLMYLQLLTLAIVSMLAVILLVRLWLGRTRKDSRGLFTYSDGHAIRSIDPVEAFLALERHDQFRFDVHPKQAADGDSESIEIVAKAVREAFMVPAYASPRKPGLTVTECHKLLGAFAAYIDLQKKSTNPSVTVPQSTDATSQASTETTSDSLPSGSLADAPA